jgi:hypothetical protein
VFADSYASAPIGKATEQLRMALLAADQKLVNRQTGRSFRQPLLFGRLQPPARPKVTVRFDPDNLAADIHLYDLDGRYLASAQRWEDSGLSAGCQKDRQVQWPTRGVLRARASRRSSCCQCAGRSRGRSMRLRPACPSQEPRARCAIAARRPLH